MSEWKKYEGTDEQIEEMLNAEHGFIIRSRGIESKITHKIDRRGLLVHCDEYLICEEHHLADMICRQAATGQPVWIKKPAYAERIDTLARTEIYYLYEVTTTPNWNIPRAEYSFEPFEEGK